MKGCLGLIIKVIVLVLVFFGLLHLGVIDFVKEKMQEHQTEKQGEIIDNTKDIVDLSQINNEYKVQKDLKFLKNRMIIAEHNATGQKMIMIEPKNEDILTQEDINDDKLQEKIDNLLTKFKYQPVKFDKLEVSKKGDFEGMGQKIPYAKVNAQISNLPVKEMEGIVGVARTQGGKNLIVISVNSKGKYSQIITDAFYEKVK